jgi:hypothetical protein
MTALRIIVLGMAALFPALRLGLRHVRTEQDAKIAEHRRRNGREWRGRGW